MRYIKIAPGSALPDVSDLSPFKAVLTVEAPVSRARQEEISLWLVEMGCRYLIACGERCQSWNDTVREANLRTIGIDSLEARDFVMTTSHPHESLRAVFWFAKKAAKHPEVQFGETVVLHLSATDRSTEYQAMFHRA